MYMYIYIIFLGKMLQVDPMKRPEVAEVVTSLETIALSRYVELKGSIVGYSVNTYLWRLQDSNRLFNPVQNILGNVLDLHIHEYHSLNFQKFQESFL